MPAPKKGARLGGSPAHQRLILSNLATALFEHGRITTTEAKARTLRPHAEKLITKAVKAHHGQNPLHQRREVLKTIRDKGVVHTLFVDIAPTFAERPGGYTRITKIAPRKGDNAPMAVIELVTEAFEPKAPAATRSLTADKTEKPAKTEPAPSLEKPADDVDPVEAKAEEAGVETYVEVDGADDEVFEETEGGFSGKYDGSHVPLEDADQAPEGFAVKGNEDSKKFHQPEGQWYEQTTADVWFDSAASAEAAGFTEAGE